MNMILILHNYMISVLQKSLVYGLYIRSQTVCCLRLFPASVVKEAKEGICLVRPKHVSILSIFYIPYVLRSYDPPKNQDAEIPHKKVRHLDGRPPGKWYKNPWWPWRSRSRRKMSFVGGISLWGTHLMIG